MTTTTKLVVVCLALSIAACTDSPSDSGVTSEGKKCQPNAEEIQEMANQALLHQYHVDVWEEGHLDHAYNYLDPAFQMHTYPILPNNQVPDANFFQNFLGAFSNLQSHEDAILAEGDLVSIQWTITATQTGDFFGIAPTNRTIQFSGMDVLRVKDDKFVDQWGGIADQTMRVAALLTAP